MNVQKRTELICDMLNKLNDEEVSRLIYDIITVYDLWFDDNKERSAEIAE